ncbi:MAG TPA: hypothetical protein VMX13_06700 [Sedimentisphaerales bacterium]|nr:hypothetical protein [Sedimentisphaerales bacterium]
MDMYDWLCSPSGALNEQIARQMFEVLPEGGPLVVILDAEGHFWPSDSERFACMNIGESFLRELRSRIDDGVEPVVTQVDDCSVVVAQLATERTHCGYVMIALAQYSPESTLANIDLVEVILNQIGLIARLVEKNNLLYELQMKQFSVYSEGEAMSN